LGIVPLRLMNWATDDNLSYVAGTRIGHEVISHISNSESGSVEDELTALGIEAWHTKCYEYRSHDGFRAPHDIFADDLGNTLRDGHWNEVDACPFTVDLDIEDRETLNTFIDDAVSIITGTLYYEWCGDNCEEAHENCPALAEYLQTNLPAIRNWLAYGMSRAIEVYGEYDPYDVFLTLKAIDGAGTELYDLYEGMQTDLVYDLSYQTAEYALIDDAYYAY